MTESVKQSVSAVSRKHDDPIVVSSSTFKPQTYESRLKMDKEVLSMSAIPKDWSLDLHENVPSLSLKALLAGVLVGTFCNFLALYYSLKTGVIPSFNIISGLGGYLLVKGFMRLGFFRGRFTPQENAVIQTTAVALYSVSSAGIGFGAGYLAMSYNAYIDSGGSEFPGNRPEDTVALTWPRNLLWCFSLSFFGFFLAFPIRNYVILKQKLPFPSGTVTACVIKNLHQAKNSLRSPMALMSKYFSISFIFGLFQWMFDGLDSVPIFGLEAGKLYHWTMAFDLGAMGIGSILALQTTGSMLLGAILTNGCLFPVIRNYFNGSGPNDWIDLDNLPGKLPMLGLPMYQIFSGLAVMITGGVWTIGAFIWMLISEYKKKKNAEPVEETLSPQEERLNEIFLASKVPTWLPGAAYLAFAGVTILALEFAFNVTWYQTLVAILIIPLFAICNVQGMGRTDWDVSSSYGKVMMFPFGAWNHGKSVIPSLALCAVTISGCSNAASLLQDFKTGHLLGASPNAMFIAQLFGAFVGCFITPTLFALLSSTYTLPSASDPHSFLQGMYGRIYRIFAVIATGSGFQALPKNVLWIAFGFVLLTLFLLILEASLPPKYAKFVPDASGLGIGIIVGPTVSMDFAIGGVVAWWWSRWDSNSSKQVPYIASGCMAGAGVSVLCRCLLSIMKVGSPMGVEYTSFKQNFGPGSWIGIVFAVLVALAVCMCGAWFWHQTREEPEEFVPFQLNAMDAIEDAGQKTAEKSA